LLRILLNLEVDSLVLNRGFPIRVMVVDDHQVVREGVISMLSAARQIEVVGQAANAPEAIRKAQELKPDVLLLDIRLPGPSGWEVCRTLSSLLPETRVIMLTSFEDEDYLFKSLRAGASGYLVKTADHEEIINAIAAVAEGRRLLSAPMVDKLVSRFAEVSRELEMRESGFDEEDIAILKLLADGSTNREIAANTHWSEVSVKRKLQTIFEKLGVEDRTSAAVEATRRGII
jgi:DNA-binding NarL/FixJ family response regulator